MRILIALLITLCAVQAVFAVVTLLVRFGGLARISLSEKGLMLKIKQSAAFKRWCRAEITVKNIYTGERTVIDTGRISPDTDSFSADLGGLRCGVISAEISSFRTGLFTLFVSKKSDVSAKSTVLIMPEIGDVTALGIPSSDSTFSDSKSRLGTPDGARDYRYGDRLRDIHMKLSAKSGRYMVRERFGNGGDGDVHIRFCGDSDPDTAEKNAEVLLSAVLSAFCEGKGCFVTCSDKTAAMQGEWDIERGFYEIFTAAGDSNGDSYSDINPEHYGGGADCVISHGEVRIL
jgi:hypothetical protein